MQAIKTIQVEGISGHGKNRVREHGARWDVLKESREKMLIVPKGQDISGWWRWMLKRQDPHFREV
jgi:hypothetical protein